VNRYDFQGTPLGSFNNGIGVDAITVVGFEVWIGTSWTNYEAVNRYDMHGALLSSFNNGIGVNRKRRPENRCTTETGSARSDSWAEAAKSGY
jgi:hypothetical protein